MRAPSLQRTLVLATFVIAVVAAGELAAAAAEPVAAVVGITSTTIPRELRRRVEDAAADGLRASGTEVRPSGSPGAEIGLRGTVNVEGSSYRLHLELVRLSSGAVLAERSDTCDVCTAAELTDMTNIAASALRAGISRDGNASSTRASSSAVPLPSTPAAGIGAATSAASQPATNPAPVDLSPADLAAVAGSSSPVAATVVTPSVSPRPLWRRIAPWAALGAGVAAIVTGFVFASYDGEPSCPAMDNTCEYQYETSAETASWLSLGAVLAIAGGGLLVW